MEFPFSPQVCGAFQRDVGAAPGSFAQKSLNDG